MIDQNTILVIGKSGQLAQALQELLPQAKFVGRPEFNIADPTSYSTIPWEGVTTIINASGYTNVDGAETPEGRREAWLVNAHGVALLAQEALRRNCTLVHVSTDYVFDGTQENHTEDEPVAPLNAYGQSKAAGEFAVSVVPKHYIVRTQWLIGNGKNFVSTMLGLGQKGIHPKVVSDQTGRLTFTSTLASAIVHLLEHTATYGTYHVSNSGPVASWADIANKVFEYAHLQTRAIPISTSEYFKDKPEAAQRPLHCEFNLEKITSTGLTLPDWQTALEDYIAHV